MHVKRITIENLRSIRRLDLDISLLASANSEGEGNGN